MQEKNKQLSALIKDDPNSQYTEEELDAIEAIDPEWALRLARVQFFQQTAPEKNDGTVSLRQVEGSIEKIKQILRRDGGDIDLVSVEDNIVTVRLKGACVGCPNATLELKTVVERIIRADSPSVAAVKNIF